MVTTGTAAVGQPVVITVAGSSTVRRVIDALIWSYSGVPTGGRLTVTDAAAQVFDMDLSLAGKDAVRFERGLQSAGFSKDFVVTLAGGGVAAIGKLNVEWHDENA